MMIFTHPGVGSGYPLSGRPQKRAPRAPDRREVRLCGRVLNELEVHACQSCGGPQPPARYLGYISSHRDTTMGKQVLRRLCPAGARKKRAQEFVKF